MKSHYYYNSYYVYFRSLYMALALKYFYICGEIEMIEFRQILQYLKGKCK